MNKNNYNEIPILELLNLDINQLRSQGIFYINLIERFDCNIFIRISEHLDLFINNEQGEREIIFFYQQYLKTNIFFLY